MRVLRLTCPSASCRRTIFLRLSWILLLFVFARVRAQDSLSFYLETAAKNNPAVLQKFSEYQAALQKVPQAGALQDPEISLGVFLEPMEILSGKQVADLRIMQMFPWFGTLKYAKDEMSLMAKSKYESFRDAKLQVFYDVQRTWYELYKVRQQMRISEKNKELLQTLERLMLVRFKTVPTGSTSSPSGGNMPARAQQNTSQSGMGMQGSSGTSAGTPAPQPSMQGTSMSSQTTGSGLADLFRIQIEIGDLSNNIALLKNQQNTIAARFNSYLNRPVTSVVFIPDTIESDTLHLSTAAVSDSMLSNNPMLSMLKYEQQSVESRKKMVTRMGYPMIGIGLNYSVVNKNEMSDSPMNGKDMIMPMLTATIPIYRKKYRSMQNEAAHLSNATSMNYQATSNSLQTEFYEALQMYQDARRRIKLYSEQSDLATRTLNIMFKSFSAGSALTDILRVRQQVLDYDFRKIEAVADFNTAIAWLKRLGGF